MGNLNSSPVIVIQDGLLNDFSVFSKLFEKYNQQVMIITDNVIAPLYLDCLIKTLKKISCFKQIDYLIVQSGDEYKNLETAQTIFTHLIENHHYRETTLIALGGGMIGDLTGFCAACYLRGVAFIQVPTTLLAQVDAAIGGKTGVNHPLGKNLIGAFYQPKGIICDIALLNSLPQREFISGLAEVLKYGLALDADFFVWIEQHISAILERKTEYLDYMVRHCIILKMNIVSRDERDKGDRVFLNFGHTLAHALESALNFQMLSHGEAVSIGLLAAVELSHIVCGLELEILIRLKKLLITIGLPVQIPKNISVNQLIQAMMTDKKNKIDHLQWVLLKGLGEATVVPGIADTTVRQVLSSLS